MSGFRLDAAQNIVEHGPGQDLQKDSPGTVAWWVEFNEAVKAADPEAMLVGEVWGTRARIGRYHVRGKGLDRCFDFPFGASIQEALVSGDPGAFIEAAMSRHDVEAPPPFFAPFLANHDQPRILTSLGGDLDKARRAAVLLLTAPGTPFLYYGEEIGMQQGQAEGEHPSARTPMQWDDSPTGGYTSAGEPWSPVAKNADPYNVAYQSGRDGSLLELYRTMIRLRSERPELRHGEYAFFDVGTGVLVFRRTYEDRSVLVLMSLSDRPQAVDARLVSGRYIDLLSGGEVAVAARFVLQPGEFSVFSPVDE